LTKVNLFLAAPFALLGPSVCQCVRLRLAVLLWSCDRVDTAIRKRHDSDRRPRSTSLRAFISIFVHCKQQQQQQTQAGSLGWPVPTKHRTQIHLCTRQEVTQHCSHPAASSKQVSKQQHNTAQRIHLEAALSGLFALTASASATGNRQRRRGAQPTHHIGKRGNQTFTPKYWAR